MGVCSRRFSITLTAGPEAEMRLWVWKKFGIRGTGVGDRGEVNPTGGLELGLSCQRATSWRVTTDMDELAEITVAES